ncbi:uncharacterized protein ACNLHF_000647 isoform 2-T8 [Anomaloglossus baeobatrachus]
MKDDKLRRRKAYRMLRRQLWDAGIGLECAPYPTYVYPANLKALIRSLFPENVCNYPDPDHEKWDAGIGLECAPYPTYVYPANLKALIRSLFPENVCNYPDPDHEKVVKVTMEDLFLAKNEKPSKPPVKADAELQG